MNARRPLYVAAGFIIFAIAMLLANKPVSPALPPNLPPLATAVAR
jgi:hypothetical protein